MISLDVKQTRVAAGGDVTATIDSAIWPVDLELHHSVSGQVAMRRPVDAKRGREGSPLTAVTGRYQIPSNVGLDEPWELVVVAPSVGARSNRIPIVVDRVQRNVEPAMVGHLLPSVAASSIYLMFGVWWGLVAAVVGAIVTTELLRRWLRRQP